jgi:hypothetical protein
MTAEEFTAFVHFVRKEYGAWEYQLAKAMGCHRTSIASWKKNGCPPYIDLACSAIVAGLDPWRPSPEDLPNPDRRSAES